MECPLTHRAAPDARASRRLNRAQWSLRSASHMRVRAIMRAGRVRHSANSTDKRCCIASLEVLGGESEHFRIQSRMRVHTHFQPSTLNAICGCVRRRAYGRTMPNIGDPRDRTLVVTHAVILLSNLMRFPGNRVFRTLLSRLPPGKCMGFP